MKFAKCCSCGKDIKEDLIETETSLYDFDNNNYRYNHTFGVKDYHASCYFNNKILLTVKQVLPLISKDTLLGFCNEQGEWITHNCHYNKLDGLWYSHHGSHETKLSDEILNSYIVEMFILDEDLVINVGNF